MLQLEQLTKRFDSTTAVDALTLEVRPGECVGLLGPSGCGKTTTLRLIAGFETPTAGRILLNDLDLTHRPPHRRGIGMVFQNYALFPHLNVYENVAFGLREQGFPKAQLKERVERALERVDLPGYGARRVQALSGGQQQRIALARALAPEPPLLLLDEPLSNLDAALRGRTRRELRIILKSVGITSVFVTHDQEEAFAISDRIALLDGGRLQQFGTPERLYQAPASPFVAMFVGGGMRVPARLVSTQGESAMCELYNGTRWPARLLATDTATQPGARVELLARPDALDLTRAAAGSASMGTVTDRRFAGAFAVYTVRVGDCDVLVNAGIDAVEIGDAVQLRPKSSISVFAFPQ